MELEWECQIVVEESLLVPAPDYERIIENAAVHANSSVNFCIDDGGCADDHAVFWQVSILAGIRYLSGIFQIFCIEVRQVLLEEDVAGTDFSCLVLNNGINSNAIVLN